MGFLLVFNDESRDLRGCCGCGEGKDGRGANGVKGKVVSSSPNKSDTRRLGLFQHRVRTRVVEIALGVVVVVVQDRTFPVVVENPHVLAFFPTNTTSIKNNNDGHIVVTQIVDSGIL